MKSAVAIPPVSVREAERPLRVVHIVPSLSFGGAARGALELAEALGADPALDVSVVVLFDDAETAGELTPPANAQLLSVAGAGPSASVRAARPLRALLRKLKADIAHSHLLPADLATALATSGSTPWRHVSHVRDTRDWLTSSRMKDRAKRAIYAAAFKHAQTRFVAVSSHAARHAERAFPHAKGRVSVVLNGVNLQRLGPDSDRQTRRAATPGAPWVIGAAGRFVPEKGHSDLLKAVAALHEKGLPVMLKLAGWGSGEARLREEAKQLGLADRLEILPKVEDMGAFYRGLDLFVMPSRATEGLPRAALEAMACGTPVLASDAAGLEDVITDRETGALAPAEAPLALAGVAEQLLTDPDLRERIAASARLNVRVRFTTDRVASDVAEFYRADFG